MVSGPGATPADFVANLGFCGANRPPGYAGEVFFPGICRVSAFHAAAHSQL